VTRRPRIAIAAVSAALLGALVLTGIGRASADCVPNPRHFPPGPASVPGRPNLILIVTDDQRWDTLWAMPNVQHLLADHGVTFANMFVTTSLCCPSRASILTGEYSRHTGVLGDAPPVGGAPAFSDKSSLATWLQAGGYTTGLVGKYLNDYPLLGQGYIPPGWDEWDAVDETHPALLYYNYRVNENGIIVRCGDQPSDYTTTALGARALQFVRTAPAPFFLYLAPIAPHQPAPAAPGDHAPTPPTPFHWPPSFGEKDLQDKPWRDVITFQNTSVAEMTRWRNHMLAALQDVDRVVGQLVAALRARGALDNTIIAFTSDNGVLLGEHRLRGKVWPYEESIRVPLVIRTPWTTTARTDSHLVLNIDLASTFAQLAGVKPGLRQDGSSLVPLLRGTPTPWRTAFTEEYLAGGLLHHGGPMPFEAIRTERYLYVQYLNGWRELYDLQADPYELDNEAGKPGWAATEKALAARLRALLLRGGPGYAAPWVISGPHGPGVPIGPTASVRRP
jgi:arylsulfatase A-like enzyme